MIRRRSFWLVALASTMLLIFGLVGNGALAQTASPDAASGTPTSSRQISFSLNPTGQPDGSFFQLSLKPGETKRLSVQFANQYDQTLALRSFVSDTFTLTNGGLGVSDEGKSTHAPTTWIEYPADTYKLKPNEGREIAFTVSVPADAKPGNYVAALVLQTADTVPVEGTALFDQIIRKAIAVDITVPGKSDPRFEIGGATYAAGPNAPSLSIDITNTGNVRLRPKGAFSVKDASGTVVLSADVTMGSVYAGTATQLQFVLQQPLPEGSYAIELNLEDVETKARASVSDLTFSASAPATPIQTTIQFSNLAVAPGPDAKAPQFANVAGTIVNGGAPISNARLTIHALKDGKEVESFPLIPSLSLAQGETPIQQRYIPGMGFTKGTWSFLLTLESVDPSSGAATLLLTQEIEQTIVVP